MANSASPSDVRPTAGQRLTRALARPASVISALDDPADAARTADTQFAARRVRLMVATCLVILALGLAARLSLLLLLQLPLTFDYAEMELIARNLAEHNRFADPYAVPTGPTAHHAPVYPFLLSLIFRIAGYGAAAALAVLIMNVLFASAQYALLPVLARQLGLPALVGIGAGLFGAALPFRFLKEVRWEAPLVALTFVIVAIVSARWARTPQPSRKLTVGLGLAWGAGFMVSPMFQSVAAAFWLLTWIFAGRGQRAARFNALVLAGIVALLVALPWGIRNYRALGGLVFTRDNFGIEFALSNHDVASPLVRDNVRNVPGNYFHLHHPWTDEGEASRVAAMGEIAYNKMRLQEALEWCRTHPGRFLRLTFERFLNFWLMPSYGQLAKDLLLFPVLFLAWAGLFRLWRTRSRAALFFTAVWVAYPLPYYFIQIDTRFRYGMDWTFYFLASYAVVAWLWSRPAAGAGIARSHTGPTRRDPYLLS